MKFRVRRLPSEAPVSIRIWPRRTPNRASPGSPFWNSTSPSASCWVWQRPADPLQFVGAKVREHRVHLQNDRKFGLFAHCNAFQIDPKPSQGPLAKLHPDEVCHKSHNFAATSGLFLARFERYPVSGISSSHRPRPAGLQIDAGCPVWNVDMRALKIAGAAIAAVIVVIALLLVIGIPSGFLTSADPGAGRARDRLQADHRRRDQDRALAVAQRDAERRHAAGPEGPRHQQPPDRRQHPGRRDAVRACGRASPQITELVIVRPVLHLPLLRERAGQPIRAARAGRRPSDRRRLAIEQSAVTGGTVVFSNLRDRVESRIEGINADVTIGGDRKITVTGNARAGEQPLKFDIKATAPAPPLERQNIPDRIQHRRARPVCRRRCRPRPRSGSTARW